MKKVTPLLLVISVIIILVACDATKKMTAAVEVKRPNIVIIMTDDHAKNAMSLYNNALIQTPNMDRIGKEGITFKNAFVTNSICGPSRSVILTGKYSHINGFRDNGDRFDGSQWTFPKELQKHGYYTAMVGKWHLSTAPTGFDYWNILIDQGQYYNPDFVEMGDTARREGYSTNLITDIAMQTLDQRPKDKPFMMLLYHKAPHRNWMPDTTHLHLYNDKDLPIPFTFYDNYDNRKAAAAQDMEIKDMFLSSDMKLYLPEGAKDTGSGGSGPNSRYNPQRDWESLYGRMNPAQKKAWDDYYKPISDAFYRNNPQGKELEEWMYQRYIKDYLRCIAAVDDNVGRFLDYLERTGELDNTLIIYTSDQGFYLGEHGWYDKRFMYEESFSTPMVMRYPKKIKAGIINNNLVLNLDLASTILDIAGVPVPADVQGESLVPLFNKKNSKDWRKSIYYHYYEYPHGWHSVKRHLGVRTDRYKLIHFYHDINEWELYDLHKDPHEMNNIYNDPVNKEIITNLKQQLKDLVEKYKDTESVSLIK
ncbi:MAG: sulfatase [Saprospiraceae bacterium]|nr:sulfatase [Saprospiraceae bacterium]